MKPNRDEFTCEVYSVVAAIPCSKVATYGQIAGLVGYRNHARLVGRVLHGTTDVAALPCHRVVNSAGRLAPGFAQQHDLLVAEGVTFKSNGCVNMKKHRWAP